MKRGKASNRYLDFYLGIPVLNLLATFRRKGVWPTSPRRIGLLFNPALGDTLLASAAVQDVRALYPQSKLIVFAAASNLGAAELLPGIDEIQCIRITRPTEAVRLLRRARLDLMLDFTSWQRLTAIYTMLSGASFKIGFKRSNQYRHRGYDRTVEHHGGCHEVENLRRMTAFLGASTAFAPRLEIPAGPVLLQNAAGKELIVFHAWPSGVQSSNREWPQERWCGLARELINDKRIFVLTGSPADEPRCRELQQSLAAQGIPAEVVIGATGIAEVARTLMKAHLLVSVNTGIMHLGAILGVPTVALNGPTSAHRWGPVGPHVANIEPTDGSGGFLDLGFEFSSKSPAVMERIPVSTVVAAVNKLLNNVYASVDSARSDATIAT